MSKAKLIVALDTPDLKTAGTLLKKLKGLPALYKIGPVLFTLAGPRAVDLVHKHGGKVFLDLKFNDIPNTVRGAVRSAAELGVYSVSLHLSGGPEMLSAAASLKSRPQLWGITVLTSFSERTFSRAGFRPGIARAVPALAALAAAGGADGVVCSPLEAAAVKKRFGGCLKIITPGIRPFGSRSAPSCLPVRGPASMGPIGACGRPGDFAPVPPRPRSNPCCHPSNDTRRRAPTPGNGDDQQRTLTPAAARAAGADFIVVGRPVLEAKDPAGAVRGILEELGSYD